MDFDSIDELFAKTHEDNNDILSTTVMEPVDTNDNTTEEEKVKVEEVVVESVDTDVNTSTNSSGDVKTSQVVQKKSEQSKTKVAKTPNVVDLPWAKTLSLVKGKQHIISEFGKQKYVYQRVELELENEEPIDTERFNVFCQIEDGEWTVLKSGVLSKRYSVVDVEEYVKEVEKTMKHDGQVTLHYKEPFYLGCRLNVQFDDDLVVFENDVAKKLFSLFSGIELDVLNDVKTGLAIQYTNAYDGSRSFGRDWIVTISTNVNGESLSFSDYFTLFDVGESTIHAGKVSNIDEIKNMKELIAGNIDKLKNVKEVDKYVPEISKKMCKESRLLFESLWSGINEGGFNNLYYMLILASMSLDRNYTITNHNRLKTYVKNLVGSLLETKVKK